MATPALNTGKHRPLQIIGLALISFSVLVTTAVLASIGVPIPVLVFLLGFNALLVYIGYRFPRAGGFLLIALSTIGLALSLPYVVFYPDLEMNFRLLMLSIVGLYFIGSLLVTISTGKSLPRASTNTFENKPSRLTPYDRILIAVGLSLSALVVFMFFWMNAHFG